MPQVFHPFVLCVVVHIKQVDGIPVPLQWIEQQVYVRHFCPYNGVNFCPYDVFHQHKAVFAKGKQAMKLYRNGALVVMDPIVPLMPRLRQPQIFNINGVFPRILCIIRKIAVFPTGRGGPRPDNP